jgi:signal transduction histidine kinase/ActR/RegA family two-component response regulator
MLPTTDTPPAAAVERRPIDAAWSVDPWRRSTRAFDQLLDWFTPGTMRIDAEARRRARMFLISHLFGPCLGLFIMASLYALDPEPGPALWVSIGAIIAFWALPPALRLTGHFTLLALLSVQNLAFVVLFVSYHYGGVSSPFLPWLITVPLLAFFYLGEDPNLRRIVLGALAVDLGAFYLAYRLAGTFPTHVPLESLSTVGIFSVFCAGVYVTSMAVYYARIVASRSELEREVQRHKATAVMLREAAVMLREAKEAAEAANRAKTDFLATMSHELRTPLNAVIGFSEMMMGQLFGPLGHDNYRGYVKDVYDSGTHLLDIINDILDIAKAESGAVELSEEVVDCHELVASACRLLRPRIDKAGLALTVAVPDDLPRLRADNRKLKQIFLNLLTNAIKFTPSAGRVVVEVWSESRIGLTISVRDTGIGIAKADLDHVLQPFAQVDSSLSRRHEGTGLGLPLVVIMMRQHGGALHLESELGKGTTARVVFPPERLVWGDAPVDARLPGAGAPAPAPVPASRASREPVTILVVEDDENLRHLLGRMLERSGFAVVTAVHGRDALRRLGEQAIGLVVTDMLMPEMDGLELMRLLRAERPSLPVIAISGVEEWAEYLRIAVHLGAKATLRKPVVAAELVRTVREALGDDQSPPSARRLEAVRTLE